MWQGIKELDRILRGEATRLSALRAGRVEIDVGRIAAVVIVLGAVYGFCMGWFALFNRESPELRQTLASTVKVPALFFLTLLVTFPSLYVFNALVGSRLSAASLLRLLVATLGVLAAVLASFGPIVAFFSLTTTKHPFMGLLNVVLFAVAGVLGLTFLLQTLHRLTITAPAEPTPPAAAEVAAPAAEAAGALDATPGVLLGRDVKIVFRCWVVVFALVGAHMSWVLRPFIGDPQVPFTWFRPRQSNFFEAVWQALRHLFA